MYIKLENLIPFNELKLKLKEIIIFLAKIIYLYEIILPIWLLFRQPKEKHITT